MTNSLLRCLQCGTPFKVMYDALGPSWEEQNCKCYDPLKEVNDAKQQKLQTGLQAGTQNLEGAG